MMLSQEEINYLVSLDILLSVGVLVVLAAYLVYKWIDYAMFVRRTSKRKENRSWP